MLLEGIFVPVTTPFHANGGLFGRKLEANVEHYSRTPSAGMIVLSGMGEPECLTDEESTSVLGNAIAAAAGEKVMIASVGRESIHKTLILAEVAAERGYDGIAVRGPRFVEDHSSREASLNYFRMVADQSSVPVILVSERDRSLSFELVAAAAQHPNVLGLVTTARAEEIRLIKDATAGVTRDVSVTPVFAAVTRRMQLAAKASASANLGGIALLNDRPVSRVRTKRVGFQVLTSTTTEMLASWSQGASGAVPPLATCAPQACCEVWQAFRDSDRALAEEKQERLRLASSWVNGETSESIAALKCGCDLNGYYGGRPRLPLLPLKQEERLKIEKQLAAMKN